MLKEHDMYVYVQVENSERLRGTANNNSTYKNNIEIAYIKPRRCDKYDKRHNVIIYSQHKSIDNNHRHYQKRILLK